jgi:asparagine synthase (glutamine-hydrolysing)
MCGINGIIDFSLNRNETVSKVRQMNDAIVHRGPDDAGDFIENGDAYSIGMGMRRLSIIDIKTGHQPMYSDDNQIVICFNGEVYNFIELKRKLESDGAIFRTNSDTEVILRMYEKEGILAFKKLDGMFSFSIYDKLSNKLIIARDFFGEKPLYYFKTDSSFVWASEIKSLKNTRLFDFKISSFSVNLFFKLTYIPAPYTIYENLFKLEPGNYLELDLYRNQISIQPYILEEKEITTQHISFDEALKKTRELVFETVKSRAISDVPIGTFLSGGVDSSIISLCLSKLSNKPIDTYSIGFENKVFDESKKASIVAGMINSNHHELILNEKDILGEIPKIISNFDEPFADSSAIPSYCVSKLAGKNVKVVLTGDGGDEVFGGYNKYLITKSNRIYTKIIPEIFHKKILKASNHFLIDKNDRRGIKFQINKLVNSIDYGNNQYWNIVSLGFNDANRRKMLKLFIKSDDLLVNQKNRYGKKSVQNLNDMREIDRILSLEGDLLTKVDRTSMLNSIECRSPFLNIRLWNFTKTLPEKYLIKGLEKKWLLRKAFENDFPKGFLDSKKHGFGIPIGDWLRTHLCDSVMKYSDRLLIEEQGIFNYDYLSEILSLHMKKERDFTFQVWSFYCFQIWYFKTHMECEY